MRTSLLIIILLFTNTIFASTKGKLEFKDFIGNYTVEEHNCDIYQSTKKDRRFDSITSIKIDFTSSAKDKGQYVEFQRSYGHSSVNINNEFVQDTSNASVRSSYFIEAKDNFNYNFLFIRSNNFKSFISINFFDIEDDRFKLTYKKETVVLNSTNKWIYKSNFSCSYQLVLK